MWPAGRQLGALLWKNWLCRLRNPVLSLAEFFWPCILFLILMVLRFQEPPRHRDNCYLQPRDLPSRGVFPFLRSLLCNTGATCRNRSYAESSEHQFRSPAFQASAGRHEAIDDLVFLQDMQDLATEVCEVMDEATNLKKLWVERSETPGSPHGSGFFTIDLNKTEEVISKLESLHQQPQIWDFLLSLPRLFANTDHADDRLGGGVPLLQAVLKILNSTKELLMMDKKLHTLEDEQMNFLLSFVEFLEKLLLPNPFNSPSGPTETVLNTSHFLVNHFKGLERKPSGIDTQKKLWEFGQEMIEKTQTVEKKESGYILRLIETILFEINPKLLELWMYGIPEGDRAKLETLSALSNFSVLRNERILSKSFNVSQLLWLDWPKSAAVKVDFVHLSETILDILCEFGFLGPEQVSEALGTVRAVRNASDLLSALSEPQKQEVGKILTHLYLNVFKDEDTAFLLQVYSSFHQYIYKFSGIQSRESLLSSLTQTSKHILEIIKQFNFQNISAAFAFLYETTEFLGGISELPYCQQLLSVFNFLEHQVHSLVSTEGPAWEATHATLMGLKQLFTEDEDFRVSLFQYVNQLFEGSAAASLGNECFAWGNKSAPPVSRSADGGSPQAQVFSHRSTRDGVFGELQALHCFVPWLRMWAEVWAGTAAQVLQWDASVFAPLHAGLSQLAEELESDVKISESCRGLFPTHRPARLLLRLLKSLPPGGGSCDREGLLALRHLWAALRGALVRVESLPWDQVERSLFAVETALRRLGAFPLNTSAGREFFRSLLGVFMELGDASEPRDRHARLIGRLLSSNLTDYEAQLESVIADLRETILFLRNVSHDRDLLSCADIFQNITEFILEDGLSHVNTSRRTLHILALLNSSFDSEGSISRLKGCIERAHGINHLCGRGNPSSSQDHLQGVLRSFGDVENKINSTLTLITWLLNTVEPGCPLNMSNINCVNIYLKNITDFLHVILTTVFEKEKVPKFEMLLTLLNDSTNQVRMIVSNLTRDFEFASPPTWKRFTELILQPIEVSDEIPSQFQNIWLHLVALGKEIQELVRDISPTILENNLSSKAEMFLSIFTTSPKEKYINHLGHSLFHLASYLAFNLSHELRNSPKIIPREVVKAVGLGIQLIRDLFNSLTPSVLHNVPEGPGNHKVMKKVASLLRALRNTDIDLLVDQLEQVGESLMEFFKNISRPGADNVGVDLLVGLMEKLVDSSRAWNANQLLRLSRLFPRQDVDVMLGLYYALPHAARLLQRAAGRNVTEVLRDLYNFTVLHGTSISSVTKEDLADAIKTLLDTVALASDKPSLLGEALTCLPVVWCRNRTSSGSQQNPKFAACHGHIHSRVASVLDSLHLSPPGEASWCSDESAQLEVTGRAVCAIQGLVDWASLLPVLSEVLHVKTSTLKHVRAVQGVWQKVLPFVPSFGNQSDGSISGLCPSGPIKQAALQIIETLKNVNFTEATPDEDILGKLAALNKVLSNEGTQASLRNISVFLGRMMKSLSGDQSLGNGTRSLASLFMTFLNANLTGRGFKALSSFLKKREAAYSFEDLWLKSEQIVKDLNRELNSRPLFSDSNKEIQTINSVALLNVTLQLAHFLENLTSSQALEITEDFPSVMKNWLHKYANEEYSRMIQALSPLTANGSSPDHTALLTAGVTTFLGYLKSVAREGDFGAGLLTQPVDREQPSNVSVVRLLLESFLINSVSNLAASPPEAAWSVGGRDLPITDLLNLTLTPAQSGEGERMTPPPGSVVEFAGQLLEAFFPLLDKEGPEKRASVLPRGFRRAAAAAEGSAAGLCEDPQPPAQPPAAAAALRRVKMLLLRALLRLAEHPSTAEALLCAARTRGPGWGRRLVAAALQAAAVLCDLYQELEEGWSSPHEVLSCEGLSGNLSRAWELFRSRLRHASAQGCARASAPDWAPQHLLGLARRLGETLFSGTPVMALLGNFSVTPGVTVRELMRNATEAAEALRAVPLSEGTVSSVLEAHVPHSQVLPGALAAALSGRCDEAVLRLLLAFPGGERPAPAARELCSLPGAATYSLLVSVGRHLDPRRFVYKTLIPAGANRVLRSLLDVVSRLSRLLPRAGRVLEHLPEFLRASGISALLDVSGFHQAPPGEQARRSAFGSFQELMKTVCKEEASFLGGSLPLLHLPRVDELLGADKEKFHVPEDATPFCLELYQEILRSPDGALVWSFLEPVLLGRILYAPNTPEVSRVIRKANHTFLFVDKLRAVAEALLKASGVFQSGGDSQLLGQLQEALRNRFVRNFVGTQLRIDMDQLMERLQTYGGTLGRMLSHAGTARVLALGRVLVNLSSCVALDRFRGLESVAELEAAARELMRENSFLASVTFNTPAAGGSSSGAGPRQLPPRVSYTIRTSLLYSLRTDLARNPFWRFHPQSLPADGFRYNYVFAPLQDMIERALVLEQTGQGAAGPAVQAQAMPYPCHHSDLFLSKVGFFFPLILMLAWVVSVASTVRQLVREREIQLDGYLSMMGVHPGTHFLAWFLENVAVAAVGSAVLAVALKASGIFAHSDALLVFLFLLDFGVSVTALSYLLSALFCRASTAALCSSLLYVTSFLPYVVLLVLRGRLGAAAQACLCLFSTTAFGQGVFLITFLEGQEAGVQWGNVEQSPEPVGMAFGAVCWVLLLDSGLYLLCGWYLSSLIPGTFGVRKPWYFPFTAAHWRSACGVAAQGLRGLCSGRPLPCADSDPAGSPLPPGEERAPGVTLVSVTKEYQPRQAAVRDLTLTFHRDQVTALLGTNGAGKTTVLSMLTGLQAPTSGTILVDGRDLQTDLPAVRRELGVCPQRDVLLDRLTVREHLLLFASLRSPQWATAERQRHVDATLRDVGLEQHRHQQARALSGGLRRKLSIGAAVLGGPRTVVLDEPTSGVDPCSRRGIWDFLLRHRQGRTIIFTTHHLDEAEALSDRVALLQQGRLQGCGPPLCLAQACGRGLRLTLTRQPSVPEADEREHTACATSLVQTYVPQARLRHSRGRELSYAVPPDANHAGLTGLFQALEQHQHRLGLTGCGLSDPTLEEVFLALSQGSGKQAEAAAGAEAESRSRGPPGRGPRRQDGAPAGTLAQAAALLAQRLRHARRAWGGTLADLLLPVLFVAVAMGLFMVRPLAVAFPPLRLSPGHHEGAEASFFSGGSGGGGGGGSEDGELAQVLLRAFGAEGLLCAGGDPDPDPKDPSCWRSDPPLRPHAPASCGCPACPNASTGAGAPTLTSRLGHSLLNLSAARLEEFLLLPSDQPRLGGWSFGVRAPGPGPEAHAAAAAATPRSLAKVWYNQKGIHALPSYLNRLNNLLLWRLLPPAEDWRRYGITLHSHPHGGALLNEDRILESVRQCGVALCIALGFSVLTASRGSAVVRDRVTGAKRLQHISGLGHGTYWFANFLYDMLVYTASVCLCVAVVLAFGLPAFTFRQNLAATALLLLLFGYATLPWMYLASRVFPSADVAFIAYVSLNFVFGLCTLLMTTMPRLLAIVSGAQNLQDISDALRWAFALFPQFCLGQGLVELCYNQIKYDLARGFGLDSYASPFAMSFLGRTFLQLACQGSALLLLRLLLHGDLLQWPRSRAASVQGTVTPCEDPDVQKEQTRVLKGGTAGDLLVLCNLGKTYRGLSGRRTAVHDVSLGLRRGECFGLLGVNGAGKTTTFEMLSGDVAPTSGHAVVRTPAGEDVALCAAQAAGIRVGYCPQQDALDEHLTGWEHLRYYCRLRGIPTSRVPEVAGDLVRRLGLEAHVDRPVATYSGGTKRKLSTALALLGKPDLLLLDEPSSGMDPCSKRLLWEAVGTEVLEGCAVVLTSHSMEECEALCTRLAIMVDGRFRCLGSPQHLRHRFGDGYTVRVWVCEEGGPHAAVSACLQRHFPGAQFKGRRLNLLEYHVPRARAGLAALFRVLESSRAALRIERYAISQATLEQVFINFAAEQQPAPAAAPDLCADGGQPHPLPV